VRHRATALRRLIDAAAVAITATRLTQQMEGVVPDNVYKKVELVGTSSNSISDAITNAIATAAQTLDNVTWFEVAEMRGHVESGKVSQYQVVLKVGFRIERETK
jgi:dodecin